MEKHVSFWGVLFFAILAISLSCEEYDKDINGNFDGENQDDRGSGDGDMYEAEDSNNANDCKVEANHHGYSGSGFMNYGGNEAWIEWENVRAEDAGEYELSFGYGNGSKGNRQSAAIINGQDIGDVAFAPTGSWRTWKTDSIVVPLEKGNNTIRIMANTDRGGPNLDYMEVLTIGGAGSNSCAEAAEHESASLSCQNGETIVSIDFASYGLPTGSCDTGFKTASCHAASSKSEVEEPCLNKQSCTVTASNGVFGDPCVGIFKKIAIAYTCSGGSVDQCPDDPNKTEPGECGCGVPEGTCNNDESWTFVVTGDSRGGDNGVNTSAWGDMVDAIIDEGAEFVLFPGDLTTSGHPDQFEQWIETTQPLYDANIDVYAVRGNHDLSSLSAWNNAFSGEYGFPRNGPSDARNLTYSATHKNALIVGLDNYSNSAKVDQNWLDARFAANTRPHVFVFGHEPAFAAKHSDTLDDDSSARDTFWESIKDAGGRAYFAGHDHFYDHARIDDRDGNPSDDIHQFIVGTAGAPLYSFDGNYDGDNGNYEPVQESYEKSKGYIVVHVDGMKVEMTFKKRSENSYVAVDEFNYIAR